MIVVAAAIVIWGWMHFFHDRFFPDEGIPSAEISHDIFATCLNSSKRLVRVKVEVRNVGTAQLNQLKNSHSIAQVSPFAEGTEFDNAVRQLETTGSEPPLMDWPEPLRNPVYSTDVDLLPDEIYEQYHDFVIAPSARVIELTSTFELTPQSTTEKIEPWQAKTIYDLGGATCP